MFYPLHEIKGNLDMTQRLSFGIYFASAPAADVRWDYAPDDGGFELCRETGGELDSISAGNYICFQQIGPNKLSVTRKNVSNKITPFFFTFKYRQKRLISPSGSSALENTTMFNGFLNS